MRVAQMTWYRSSNYGSVLQAYALQRTLESLDADPKLINYDPAPYQHRNHSRLRRSKIFRSARVAQQRFMGVAPFVSKAKNAAFAAFLAQYMKETASIATAQDFKRLNDCFDAFICGSDQVWSPRCFDPRFFLDFVETGKRKIAYAPSFGCDELPSGARGAMAPLVASFDALSARESKGAQMIEALCGKRCRVVADPVLLLTREEWGAIADEGAAVERPYCLCYFLGRSKENWGSAVRIAQLKDLDLVVVPVFNGDMRRNALAPGNIGPRQFLGLLSRASYVCTDSFHGLVFATIFEREFTVFERFRAGSAASQNVRIENYLKVTGLEDRIGRRDSVHREMELSTIEYADVRGRIAALRTSSLDYLRFALDV